MVTIDEVKRKHREKGKFFFSEGAMKFFNSKIETSGNLIGDKFFITSEKGPSNIRKFTIREFDENTGDIETVGDFNEIKDKKDAKDIAKCMVDGTSFDLCKFRVKGI